MSNNNKTAGGVSTTTVLQIVFLVLKLTKLINWSWFWVLSPTIFSAGLVVLYLAVVTAIMAAKGIKKHRKLKKEIKQVEDEYEKERTLVNDYAFDMEKEIIKEKTNDVNRVSKTMTNDTVKQDVRAEYELDDQPIEELSGPSLKMTRNNRYK